MRIYLAGPMRGCPELNFPEFDRRQRQWEEAGHTVISPAATSRSLGYPPEYLTSLRDGAELDKYLRHVMTVDITSITHCNAIALLAGWDKSLGATTELAYAQFLSLPVYCALKMTRINPCPKPWCKLASAYLS